MGEGGRLWGSLNKDCNIVVNSVSFQAQSVKNRYNLAFEDRAHSRKNRNDPLFLMFLTRKSVVNIVSFLQVFQQPSMLNHGLFL